MIRWGFVSSVINLIAVTSLKGSDNGAIWDAERILLFTYITDRGRMSSLIVVGSIVVHA
jgi:hypothetical protein